VYRFNEEDTERFALTADKGGARLPPLGCVWRFAGPVELDRPDVHSIGLKPGRIKEAFLKKGFFLWPDDAEELGREGS
jgi:hypothetical protein